MPCASPGGPLAALEYVDDWQLLSEVPKGKGLRLPRTDHPSGRRCAKRGALEHSFQKELSIPFKQPLFKGMHHRAGPSPPKRSPSIPHVCRHGSFRSRRRRVNSSFGADENVMFGVSFSSSSASNWLMAGAASGASLRLRFHWRGRGDWRGSLGREAQGPNRTKSPSRAPALTGRNLLPEPKRRAKWVPRRLWSTFGPWCEWFPTTQSTFTPNLVPRSTKSRFYVALFFMGRK